jgi:hypothetical protein
MDIWAEGYTAQRTYDDAGLCTRDAPHPNGWSTRPLKWIDRSETKTGPMDSAREQHGIFRCGAFIAARSRRPSIQYSGVVSPQART